MSTDCSQQLTFWEMGTQQVTVDFQGGRVVTDTGLLPIRLLDKELGILSRIAATADPWTMQQFDRARDKVYGRYPSVWDLWQMLATIEPAR